MHAAYGIDGPVQSSQMSVEITPGTNLPASHRVKAHINASWATHPAAKSSSPQQAFLQMPAVLDTRLGSTACAGSVSSPSQMDCRTHTPGQRILFQSELLKFGNSSSPSEGYSWRKAGSNWRYAETYTARHFIAQHHASPQACSMTACAHSMRVPAA